MSSQHAHDAVAASESVKTDAFSVLWAPDLVSEADKATFNTLIIYIDKTVEGCIVSLSLSLSLSSIHFISILFVAPVPV